MITFELIKWVFIVNNWVNGFKYRIIHYLISKLNMFNVLELDVMRGFCLCFIVYIYPSIYLSCCLHEQKCLLHCFSQHYDFFPTVLHIITPYNSHEDVSSADPKVDWWTEIWHSGNNLKEVC